MPTVIIAGLPVESDRRVQSALRQQTPFQADWKVIWMRSKGGVAGLAPSQLDGVSQAASTDNGAHLIVFRGREKHEEEAVKIRLGRFFRIRWLDHTLLRLIPCGMDRFFSAIIEVLVEEQEWIDTVKPRSEACCMLLPECAFSAEPGVRHMWTAASEPGIERIRLAARATKQFEATHWLQQKNGVRAWTDGDDRIFDHRGARHGSAPFPRMWKFSYQMAPGFHFDVTSRFSRPFHIRAFDGTRHKALALGHINIDPHGYVR